MHINVLKKTNYKLRVYETTVAKRGKGLFCFKEFNPNLMDISKPLFHPKLVSLNIVSSEFS